MINQHPERNKTAPPVLASLLLKFSLPRYLCDNISGDLEEEFYDLADRDINKARRWYWQQSLITSLIYLNKKLASAAFAAALNRILAVSVFMLMVLMVFFLSNMDSLDNYSDGAWDALMAGRIDFFLSEPEFWGTVPGQLGAAFYDLDMYLNLPSMLFAMLSLGILLLLDKRQGLNAIKMALWGYTLCSLPYLWGLLEIATHHYAPREVGPIIAFMLISPLYLLLPVGYLVNKKLSSATAQHVGKLL